MVSMSCLPFSATGDFRPAAYTLGHQQLFLHSYDREREILFTGVERMELDPRFTGGLTIEPVCSHGDLDDGAALPLLLLKLTGATFGSGFVACAQVIVSRLSWEGHKIIDRQNVFGEGSAYSLYAIGGQRAEPGDAQFGLPVLRRYSREKRITARFPPPPRQD